MLRLRDEYQDSIVFAFKPHPMMLTKLYREWGKDRADAYYRNWAEGENSFLADGPYIDLFAQILSRLRPDIVVERFASEAPPRYHYGRNWGLVRNETLWAMLEKRLLEKNMYQGKNFVPLQH
jgi:radical SAM superfamily enzyme